MKSKEISEENVTNNNTGYNLIFPVHNTVKNPIKEVDEEYEDSKEVLNFKSKSKLTDKNIVNTQKDKCYKNEIYE